MTQSITSKYLSATNTLGPRISVKSSGGIRRIYDWVSDDDIELNHTRAVDKFLLDMNWPGTWIGGETETGMVFVRSDRYAPQIVIDRRIT